MIVTSSRPKDGFSHGLSKNFPYSNTIAAFGNLCPNIISDKSEFQIAMSTKLEKGSTPQF